MDCRGYKAAKSDRRNLSDADMIRWIAEVDKRKTAQERAAMAGRPKAGENLTSREVKLSPHHARSSAQQTADIVGTSRAKVEKARRRVVRPAGEGVVIA